MFYGQRQRYAEVRVSKRPGWDGIMIPTECYCFNITRNNNACLNYGRLIHRVSNNYGGAIESFECDKIALNPWFDVLLDTYFQSSDLNITYFSNPVKTNNYQERPCFEKRKFHYSNAGERAFVSFIPNDQEVKQIITAGISDCLKLMPFTPRSILIYKNDCNCVVEVTSIGVEHYESSIVSDVKGFNLTRSTCQIKFINSNLCYVL